MHNGAWSVNLLKGRGCATPTLQQGGMPMSLEGNMVIPVYWIWGRGSRL